MRELCAQLQKGEVTDVRSASSSLPASACAGKRVTETAATPPPELSPIMRKNRVPIRVKTIAIAAADGHQTNPGNTSKAVLCTSSARIPYNSVFLSGCRRPQIGSGLPMMSRKLKPAAGCRRQLLATSRHRQSLPPDEAAQTASHRENLRPVQPPSPAGYRRRWFTSSTPRSVDGRAPPTIVLCGGE